MLFSLLFVLNVVEGKSIQNERIFEWGLPYYSIYSFDDIGIAMPGAKLSSDSLGRLTITEMGKHRVFDGKNWEDLLDPTRTAYDLTVVEEGRNNVVYSGRVGSWGYLIESEGRIKKGLSLKTEDAPEWTNNVRIIDILEFEDYVMYVGDLGAIVFHFSDQSHVYYQYVLATRIAFKLGGRAFVPSDQLGLMVFDGHGFETIENGSFFNNSRAIVDSSPVDDESILLATLRAGLFRFNGEKIEHFDTEIDELAEKGISAIEVLPDGRVAVAIRNEGLFVLFSDGRIQCSLSRKYTSEFSSVNDLYRTEDGILWATLNHGIAKIFMENGITFFDNRMGLPIYWPRVHRLNGKLVVRTENEIYQALYNKKSRLIGFEMVELPGLDSAISGIAVHETGLLLSCSNGLYHRDHTGSLSAIIEGYNISRVYANPTHPDRFLVLGTDFNTLIVYQDGEFKEVGTRISSIGFPSMIIPDDYGNFWIELGIGRFGFIKVQNDSFDQVVFDRVPGLLDHWVNIWKLKGEIYISTQKTNIIKYNYETNTFIRATDIEKLFSKNIPGISRPVENVDSTFWIPHRNGIDLMIPNDDGSYKLDSISLNVYKGNNAVITKEEESGTLWLSTENKLTRYDASMGVYEVPVPSPQLTAVIAMGGGEVIYNPLNQNGDMPVETKIPFRNNSLTFYISPTNYAISGAPMYQTLLEGLSTDWSFPDSDTSISYTNLQEGSYTLWIRIQGSDGTIGVPVSYSFVIDPPVYRSWYAYFLYSAIVILIVSLIVRWFLWRADIENSRLENLVTARTEELDHTNERLRLAVKSAEHAAEVKSQFLANMSHEIRTPMNGVIGTAQLMKETQLTEEQQELLGMIDQSGNLLLHIINDILDYSKAEAGKIELESVEFNLEELIESVLDILSSRIGENHAVFLSRIDPNLPNCLLGDPIRIQQVLINFCSNAIKFTQKGHILLQVNGECSSVGNNRWKINFLVEDTGIGMSEQNQKNLFTPFSQLDTSNARVYGGTGLGLAISGRLVGLMGSSIEVSSEEGVGSCFSFNVSLESVADSSVHIERNNYSDKVIWIVDEHDTRVSGVCEHLQACGCQSISRLTTAAIKTRLEENDYPNLMLVAGNFTESDFQSSFGAFDKLKIPVVFYGSILEFKVGMPWVDCMNYPLKFSRLRNHLQRLIKTKMKVDPSHSVANVVESVSIDRSKPILVVEDSPTNQRVLELMLKRFKLQIEFAKDGREAVDAVQANEFSIILMDVQLPGMDGMEATRIIRGMLKKELQPIIIGVSANVMEQDISKAMEAGMNEYLLKPIRMSRLYEVITKYLRITDE